MSATRQAYDNLRQGLRSHSTMASGGSHEGKQRVLKIRREDDQPVVAVNSSRLGRAGADAGVSRRGPVGE